MRRVFARCFRESNRLAGRSTAEDIPVSIGVDPKQISSDRASATQVNRARHLRVRGCESCL